MRVLIGVPCARFIRSVFTTDFSEWADWHTTKHDIYLRMDATSGRIDWSRSNLIGHALRMKVDLLIMMDSDAKMITSLRDTLSFVQQDISRGFDCIIGPTIGVNGRVMMRFLDDWPKDKPPSGKSAFEIVAGAFGFVALTRKCLEGWKPVSHIIDIQNVKYPLYMDYSNNTTEDFNACYRIRESGFKVACDPRIRVGHIKEIILHPRWYDDEGTVSSESQGVNQFATPDPNAHMPDPTRGV